MIEFTPIICRCGAVVMDGYGLQGVGRPICPRCKRRVTVHFAGHESRVVSVDKKPSKLPTAVA